MESGATAASSGKCYHVENTLWFLQCAKSILISQWVSVFTQNIFFKYLKVFLKKMPWLVKIRACQHEYIKQNIKSLKQMFKWYGN